MRFLVDNQLPASLARYLASRGLDCQHVLDIGFDTATDAAVWDYACRHGCIIISKDEDFLYRASKPSAQARLIWVRLGNCRNRTLIEVFERLWPKIEASLEAGDRIIELR